MRARAQRYGCDVRSLTKQFAAKRAEIKLFVARWSRRPRTRSLRGQMLGQNCICRRQISQWSVLKTVKRLRNGRALASSPAGRSQAAAVGNVAIGIEKWRCHARNLAPLSPTGSSVGLLCAPRPRRRSSGDSFPQSANVGCLSSTAFPFELFQLVGISGKARSHVPRRWAWDHRVKRGITEVAICLFMLLQKVIQDLSRAIITKKIFLGVCRPDAKYGNCCRCDHQRLHLMLL